MWSLFVVASLMAEPQASTPKGQLVVVGGGTTSAEIVDKTLELAGGKVDLRAAQ